MLIWQTGSVSYVQNTILSTVLSFPKFRVYWGNRLKDGIYFCYKAKQFKYSNKD